MSTPIFDALYAESDDTTRALVWAAVRPTVSVKITVNTARINAVLASAAKAICAGMQMDRAMTAALATAHKNSDQVRGDGLLGGLEL